MTESEQTQTPAYFWFDAEFTDLDPAKAHLLQVALVPTDVELHRLLPAEEDIDLCVRLPDGAEISEWVAENLERLVNVCRTDQAHDVEEVDRTLAAYVDSLLGPPSSEMSMRPVLAGNSVHMDVQMMRKHLPLFASRLHYRLLDVSVLKILWQDWYTGEAFDKENAKLIQQFFPGEVDLTGKPHDAYYDIVASIAELNYYRRVMLTP
ncbi:MAG: hypothetical protein KJ626_07750 [Verrucomicrobia bacterium]|nr:hypothetical protein [Verrucomicrobiota bacterium]